MTQVVGANSPCPCGSGKKYKYCCRDKDRAAAPTRTRKPRRTSAAATPAPRTKATAPPASTRSDAPAARGAPVREAPAGTRQQTQQPASAPPPRERAIRVFVSSTFLDMQAERTELVKRVFPQLRKLCESRGVTWGEVDLRWGISDEQKAEGKILPICLAEIHNCRPYFLGILGQRYGWVPDELPAEAVEREPWLDEHRESSITELEILHGALNEPEMAERAFFYFRDPAYSDSLPQVWPEYREGPLPLEIERFGEAEANRRAEARLAKLDALKQRIRTSGFPVRENYSDPTALGRLVLEDLTAVIERVYPAGSEPDPLDREAMAHEGFARSRARVYIGRREQFDRLDDHVQGSGPPLVILGKSGSGKSALLANWAERFRTTHPEVPVVAHFIGASAESTDWAATLRRLLGELSRQLGLELEIPTERDSLAAAFVSGLHMAAARQRFVLVLDALNQLEDREGALDLVWLPEQVPDNARLVISTLPGRALDALTARAWPTLAIEPLESRERERLVIDYLGQYRKQLDRERVELVISAPQTANPLYLRTLLEELRLWGEHETLVPRIRHYLAAAEPIELFGKILERYEEDYENGRPGLVRDAMSLLWASRRGLSEAELLDLLGVDGVPLPGAIWSPLRLAAEHALLNRSGLLAFSHEYFEAAVRTRYVDDESSRRKARLELADYFTARELGPRKLEELPWQLARLREWRRLARELAEPAFLQAAWNWNRLEVRRVWAEVEANSNEQIAHSYAPIIRAPGDDEDLAWAVATLLREAGHLEEAHAFWGRIAEGLAQKGDRANLVVARGNQALILETLGELEKALELHREVETLCRALGLKDGLARALGNQANVVRALGDPRRALQLHAEEERLYRELGSKEGLQVSLGSQAPILSALGETDAAMARLEQQAQLCRALGNQEGLGFSLANQAEILARHGDLEKASTLLDEADPIFRALGNTEGLAGCLTTRANKLLSRGEFDEALRLEKEAERLHHQLGSKEGVARSLGNQAGICLARGDLPHAWALLEEQEQLCRALKSREGLAGCLTNQASILRARGDVRGAFALLREAEAIARALGHQEQLQRILGNQGVILKDTGNLDGALALHEEQERICRDIGQKQNLLESLLNQAVIHRARGDLRKAMALLGEQEQLCRELEHPVGLQACLGEQALVLQASDDFDRARRLLEQQEQICRQIGYAEGLIKSLANQAALISVAGGPSSRMRPLLDEAQRLAVQAGLAGLAQHVAWVRSRLL